MLKRHEIQVLAGAGHSRAEIARLAGVSERSVYRVLKEASVTHVDEGVAVRSRGVGRPGKAREHQDLVVAGLGEDPQMRSAELLRRARLAGYRGGKSALYELIRQHRPSKEALVTRFEGLPGEFSQHDFGVVDVRFRNGERLRVTFFASRLKYSRFSVVTLVDNQQTETLVRTLLEHFKVFGGVPLLAVFDRPKTVAIAWGKDGRVTEYNPIFAQAVFEMGVGVEVCWPYSPQQKGSVENLVGWVKGSFFKSRTFEDRDDLVAQLAEWHIEANDRRISRATGVTPASLMGTERLRLRPLRVQPGELALRIPVQVSPTAMVSHDTHQYSMPPEAAHLSATLFLYADRVRIVAGRFETEHPRCRERDEKSILPEHRAARLAAVHGKRGKRYLKRQDILDVGEIALTLLDEIVHRRPDTWYQDVDVLHDVLQQHGEGVLRLAIHLAVAEGDFSGQGVARQLRQAVNSELPL